MKTFWDERYSGEDFFYGEAPNPFFKSFIDQLKPGTLLLPAEGEGRNALYAASQGWQVTAIDYSDVARRKALDRAAALHLEINYLIEDLASFNPPEESYDAIALVFLHLPMEDRILIHHRLLKGLKRGGSLFLTGFTKEQLTYSSGGPKVESMLFSPAEVGADFSHLKPVRNEKLVTVLDEGPGHAGEAAVMVFQGVK